MRPSAADLLAAHPFLDGLTDRQLERLAPCAKRSMFHAGARIFNEGGLADRFWLIVRGRVDLDAHVPGRGEVVLESLGDGSVLGWSWLFPPYRWHLGAVAVETTFTVEMDGSGVRELCAIDPAMGYLLTSRFMQVVVDRLHAARLRLREAYAEPA